MRNVPLRGVPTTVRGQIAHRRPPTLRCIENRAMAEALVFLQLNVFAEVGNRLGIMERHLAIATPVNDESWRLHRLQEVDCREGADGPVANAFQVVLVGALPSGRVRPS